MHSIRNSITIENEWFGNLERFFLSVSFSLYLSTLHSHSVRWGENVEAHNSNLNGQLFISSPQNIEERWDFGITFGYSYKCSYIYVDFHKNCIWTDIFLYLKWFWNLRTSPILLYQPDLCSFIPVG